MVYVIGVDPGPMVGIVGFDTAVARLAAAEPIVIQCSANVFADVLSAVLVGQGDVVLAVERFVISPLSARANAPSAGKVARDVVADCEHYAEAHELQCFLRSAAQVKPWATDARLTAAGLTEATRGMPHARDAARHALYAAVHDCGLLDPLSRHRSVS